MDSPLYPEVSVKLMGEDGNAFLIIARVKIAMRMAGIPDRQIEKYQKEATSGDYDHLLQTTLRWIDVQ